MNPIIAILLIVLAVLAVILLIALLLSVVVLAAGRRFSQQQYEQLVMQIKALLKQAGADEQLAQKLVEGQTELPQDINPETAEQLTQILDAWHQDQERIRLESEKNSKNRKRKITDLFWKAKPEETMEKKL